MDILRGSRIGRAMSVYGVRVSLDVVPPYAKEYLSGSDVGLVLTEFISLR